MNNRHILSFFERIDDFKALPLCFIFLKLKNWVHLLLNKSFN